MELDAILFVSVVHLCTWCRSFDLKLLLPRNLQHMQRQYPWLLVLLIAIKLFLIYLTGFTLASTTRMHHILHHPLPDDFQKIVFNLGAGCQNFNT